MLNKKLLENGVVNAVTIDELDAQFGGMSKRDCNLMKACCAGQAVTYAIHSLL
ncbi:enterocin 96, partial [Enterococcus faecium]